MSDLPDEKIDDLPGLYEPQPFQKPEVIVPEDHDQDSEQARLGYYKVRAQVEAATDLLHEEAHVARHPRHFEVLGQLLRVALEANDRIRDQAQIKEGPKTINNTLVLSSSEILDLVKKKNQPS